MEMLWVGQWSLPVSDFAAALANPIAYQSALEKHAEQLAVLEEDFDAPVSNNIITNNMYTKDGRNEKKDIGNTVNEIWFESLYHSVDTGLGMRFSPRWGLKWLSSLFHTLWLIRSQ